MPARRKSSTTDTAAHLGFEAKLWLAASKGEYAVANLEDSNLALRGIEADIGKKHSDTFRTVLHPDLRADTATRGSVKPCRRSQIAGRPRSGEQLLANPPFNGSGTTPRACTLHQDEAKLQFESEAEPASHAKYYKNRGNGGDDRECFPDPHNPAKRSIKYTRLYTK